MSKESGATCGLYMSKVTEWMIEIERLPNRAVVKRINSKLERLETYVDCGSMERL